MVAGARHHATPAAPRVLPPFISAASFGWRFRQPGLSAHLRHPPHLSHTSNLPPTCPHRKLHRNPHRKHHASTGDGHVLAGKRCLLDCRLRPIVICSAGRSWRRSKAGTAAAQGDRAVAQPLLKDLQVGAFILFYFIYFCPVFLGMSSSTSRTPS